MKRNYLKKSSLFLALIFIISAAVISLPATVSAATSGTVYYVDSAAGNDNNSGTSTDSPWQSLAKVNTTTFKPGDSIHFKRGCSFTGCLYPKGSGASGSPITFDAYGTGSLPVINGNTQSSSPGSKMPVDAAVYISGLNYITISDLEITNYAAGDTNLTKLGYWQGIHLTGAYGYSNITIQNCKIHNIAGDTNSSENLAAILIYSSSYTPSSNIQINNNEIYNAYGSGMHLDLNGGTGLIVQNNYLHEIGGDGINVMSANSPLIQNNIVADSHMKSSQYDDALWPYNCSNALFQNNEVYDTQTTKDGYGLDADYQCRNTIFQYNYVHDNQGGFLNVCCEPSTYDGHESYNDGTIVRYNIAQNNYNVTFSLFTKITNTYIYNNTLYIKSGMYSQILAIGSRSRSYIYPDNTYFYNNIIYNYGSGGYSNGYATNTTWDYNMFYGTHPYSEPSDAHKLTSDPKFVNPGSAGDGISTCSGYKLQAGSPALNSGSLISNNGGKDFFGNTVSSSAAPNRGAFGGALSDYIIPYTISNGNLQGLTVGSNSFSVFTNSFVPSSNTNILVYDKNGNQVTGGNIGTGMTVKINVKGSIAGQYTVIVYGDVDGNGKIDSTDLVKIKQHILNKQKLTGIYLNAANADRDANKNVNSSDLVAVKNAILKKAAINQK